MKTKRIILLSIFLIILAFTLQGTAFASDDSELTENINAGCRDDNILVFRVLNHEYVCTSPSTAEKWVKLGLAEIVQNNIIEPIDTNFTMPL